MDNSSDKESKLPVNSHSTAVEGTVQRSSRRRFTRNAVLGSAVLLSLGNRAAWGDIGENVGECMSGPIWASYTMAGNTFLSVHTADHDGVLADDIDQLLGAGGKIPPYQACPDGTGGYCIEQGACSK